MNRSGCAYALSITFPLSRNRASAHPFETNCLDIESKCLVLFSDEIIFADH